MTNEYVRAMREQGLGYRDLKEISRAGLEYSFLPGASLWQGRHMGVPVAACAGGFDMVSCRDLAKSSEKAGLQLALEGQFATFERKVVEENKRIEENRKGA
jgi:adenosine deaminase